MRDTGNRDGRYASSMGLLEFRMKIVKKRTRGKMSSTAYAELYRCARSAGEGRLVEIGPAQGASTIALALGRKKSLYPVDLISIDRFERSNSLRSTVDRDTNISQLKSNLSKYKVSDDVKIFTVSDNSRREYAAINDTPISLLFIDADGAIEKDLDALFEQLSAGCRVILDDFEDKISNLAHRKYLKFSMEDEIQYLRHHDVESFAELVPLGKSLTVFRIASILIRFGILETGFTIGNTLFTRLPDILPTRQNFDAALRECGAEREQILEEFNDLRERLNRR